MLLLVQKTMPNGEEPERCWTTVVEKRRGKVVRVDTIPQIAAVRMCLAFRLPNQTTQTRTQTHQDSYLTRLNSPRLNSPRLIDLLRRTLV